VIDMPRTLNTAIDVKDLEHAVEHLVRLAYSPIRAGEIEGQHSIVVERESVLRVALETERLVGVALSGESDQEFVERVDRCCRDLESVVKKTLSYEGMKKMRAAIRQKRLSSRSNLVDTYAECQEKALNI
jgi:hypothetical protein